jgi:hypothetical protein
VSPRLDLQLDTDRLEFQPGDWVRGRVAVLEGGKSRDLSVRVRYREKSPDYDATVVEHTSGALCTGDLTAGRTYDFAIQIPSDALPSYSSVHGDLWWEVEARSNEFGVDTKTTQRIDVVVQRAREPAA